MGELQVLWLGLQTSTIIFNLRVIIPFAPTTDRMGRAWYLGVRGDMWTRARGARARG